MSGFTGTYAGLARMPLQSRAPGSLTSTVIWPAPPPVPWTTRFDVVPVAVPWQVWPAVQSTMTSCAGGAVVDVVLVVDVVDVVVVLVVVVGPLPLPEPGETHP